MSARRRRLAIAAGTIAASVVAAALYAAALPAPHVKPAPRPVAARATPPTDKTGFDPAAEHEYDRQERRYEKSAAKEHDTPLIDFCTGKPIPLGTPTTDAHGKADCPAPTATTGAYEAVEALEHECLTNKRTPGATHRAAAYLLHEARTRATADLVDLLLEVIDTELYDCDTDASLDLAIKFINAGERIVEELRPYNRFLDGPNEKKQSRRQHRLDVAHDRVN